jgi:hypothetical protein
MTQEQSYELGRYRGDTYSMAIRGDPDLTDPADFAVVVYYRDSTRGETVEVARIDTADGFTHIDRLYRRDEPKDPVDMDVWEAVEHFFENWRTYAEEHAKAHGNR